MNFDIVRQLPLDAVRSDELRPQAMLHCSSERLSTHAGIRFERGEDDLDGFEAAALLLTAEAELAQVQGHAPYPSSLLGREKQAGVQPLTLILQRYDGEPDQVLTLFLPASISAGADIASAVDRVATALHLGPNVVIWQRSDDPTL